ncbi:MAG: apolipoprotein N-acyltransferase, partial [Opitutales bacterium]|nr:apolipoprotein N-acyltransferase [Opitutales bacterium]
MVISQKKSIAGVCIASALSFVLYAFAFEPNGIAELAYIFAIPAIIACKILFVENKEYRKISLACVRTQNEKSKKFYGQILDKFSKVKKAYLLTTFVCSYLAWIWLLIWLRHVYPPSGWIGVVLLPLAVSTLFIFPWFALLPILLPSSEEDAITRLIKLAGLASIWVLLEWIRTWLFTGFPWLLLANSQWTRIAVIQSASWGGVWIVSFMLIFFNLATAEYLYKLYALQKAKFIKQDCKLSKITPEFYVALLLVMSGVWTYVANLPRAENEKVLFKAGLVQTDFAGILKWSDNLASENLAVIRTLSEGLADTGVDIILLPEAATPPRFPINYPLMKNWIETLAKDIKTPLLTGNMTYDVKTASAQNGAFFVSETKGISPQFYAKKHLVPFGEYVPKLFWFLDKVV